MSEHDHGRRQEFHIVHHFPDVAEIARPILDYLQNILHELHQLKQLGPKMSQMDDNITALQASVANLTSVDQSAIALIQGFGAQVQAAVDAALAAGATPTQLQAMTDLKSAIDTQDDALAAAVSAATPAAGGGGGQPTARRP